jgi:hypothetical protein
MGIGVAPSIANVSAMLAGKSAQDGSLTGTSAVSTEALLF